MKSIIFFFIKGFDCFYLLITKRLNLMNSESLIADEVFRAAISLERRYGNGASLFTIGENRFYF